MQARRFLFYIYHRRRSLAVSLLVAQRQTNTHTHTHTVSLLWAGALQSWISQRGYTRVYELWRSGRMGTWAWAWRCRASASCWGGPTCSASPTRATGRATRPSAAAGRGGPPASPVVALPPPRRKQRRGERRKEEEEEEEEEEEGEGRGRARRVTRVVLRREGLARRRKTSPWTLARRAQPLQQRRAPRAARQRRR